MSDSPTPSELPRPVIRQHRRISPSLIWLVPAVAALAAIILVVRAYTSAGPSIVIRFDTAEGLEEGKTEVKFKNVVVGKVREIRLGDEHRHVYVDVALNKNARNFAVADTRFWVVRPRADLGGISGVTTLFSGTYIGVDAGSSEDEQYDFVGLETPPAVTSDERGKRFVLISSDLSSLSIGSPIYYRRLPVGRIAAYELAKDGKSVQLQAFVYSPYDRYVTPQTRFWNASGVDLQLDASGLKLKTQGLAAMIAGGVAFADLQESTEQAPSGSSYTLFADQERALTPPDGASVDIALRFSQSVRGLAVGAPVDFKGIELGRVTHIALDFDATRKRFDTRVSARIFPERLGPSYQKFRESEGKDSTTPEALLGRLIERGLRAQLRTGNLLTGQLYVALDFMPKAEPVSVDLSRKPLEIPTARGSLDQIQTQIASIVAKIDEVPIKDIGNNLRDTLKSADNLLKQLDTELAPEAKKTLEEARQTLDSVNDTLNTPDGGMGHNVQETMQELQRAARSLRTLGDYLQRHPEALLRGKPDPADPEPKK